MPDSSPEMTEALREENARLRRVVEELSLLNEAATLLNEAEDLQAALEGLVRRTCRATGATQGVIVLVEEPAPGDDSPPTLLRSAATQAEHEVLRPSLKAVSWLQRFRRPLLVADPPRDASLPGDRWPDAVDNVLAVPMLAGGRLIGVLAHYNSPAPGGFTDDDARLLGNLAAQSAQGVERKRLAEEQREVLRLFGPHTAPAAVKELLRSGADASSRRAEVCVMFLDIRGFSERAEAWPPEQVVAYLDAVFNLSIGHVGRHYGIVHQLLGDGFMAIFGAPVAHGNESQNAVDAALAIVASVEQACAAGELPPTRIGIGLHAGMVVAGTVGSASHKEYKVTGDVVNVAARIEQHNKKADSQLLISEAVWHRLKEPRPPAEQLGRVTVKGRREAVTIYRLA